MARRGAVESNVRSRPHPAIRTAANATSARRRRGWVVRWEYRSRLLLRDCGGQPLTRWGGALRRRCSGCRYGRFSRSRRARREPRWASRAAFPNSTGSDRERGHRLGDYEPKGARSRRLGHSYLALGTLSATKRAKSAHGHGGHPSRAGRGSDRGASPPDTSDPAHGRMRRPPRGARTARTASHSPASAVS